MAGWLCPSGYGIPKDSLPTERLQELKAALTVKPINMMEEYLPATDTSFSVYEETADALYVPKVFGFNHFGKPEKIDLPEGVDIDVGFEGELRESQRGPALAYIEATKDPVKMGGIVNLACAGGKTVIALYIIANIKKKAIIVCHKEFLINQWKERITQFLPSASVGIIKAKVCDVADRDIVIASLQSLSMKNYDPSTFDDFGISVYDECHHTSAAVFSRVFRTVCTRYTLGLSATLERKDGLTKVFKWHIGDVVYKPQKTNADLSSARDVQVVIIPYYNSSPMYNRVSTIFGGQKPNTARMINNICEFAPRVAFIVQCTLQILDNEPSRKILILSDRRGHLEELNRQFGQAGVEAGLYYGGLKQSVLQESEQKSILLGTYSYISEGFDNKDLNTLILASPKSDIVQVVGRIMRTPPGERTCNPLVIDIVDKFSIFPNQGRARMRYYRSQGYSIGNVSSSDISQLASQLQTILASICGPRESLYRIAEDQE